MALFGARPQLGDWLTRLTVGAALAAILGLSSGCLTRRILIESEPPGAQVVVNQRVVGTSPVVVETADFGDLDLRLELPGYEPLWTTLPQPRPWWGYDPMLLIELCPYPFQKDTAFKAPLERQQPVDLKVLKQHADDAAKEPITKP